MRALKLAAVAAFVGFGTAAGQEKPIEAVAPAGAVKVVRDLAYVEGEGADAQRNRLDVYLPEGRQGFPTLVFFHGGGFAKGDRKGVERFARTLAGQGIAVVAAGYRLVPQAKHPQQVQDAARAVAWVKGHIAAHGGRQDRILVGGHSAGALLAALLATDVQYLKAAGASLGDVRGVVSLSGLYRIPEKRQDVFGDEASRKAASPASHVRPGLPAFFLAYADKDSPGRDRETREFAAALRSAQVRVEVHEARDRDHGGIFGRIDAGDPTGAAVVAFVRSAVAADKATAAR